MDQVGGKFKIYHSCVLQQLTKTTSSSCSCLSTAKSQPQENRSEMPLKNLWSEPKSKQNQWKSLTLLIAKHKLCTSLSSKGHAAHTDQDLTPLIAARAIQSICNMQITSWNKRRSNFKTDLILTAFKDLKIACSVWLTKMKSPSNWPRFLRQHNLNYSSTCWTVTYCLHTATSN